MSNRKSVSWGAKSAPLLKMILPWAVVLIVALVIIKPLRSALNGLFQKMGLMGASPAQKAIEQENAKGTGSPWSPAFYKQFPGAMLIRVMDCDRIIKQILDGFGHYDDNEEQVMGAIKNNIRYQTQLSFLCERWQQTHPDKGTLLDYLKGGNWPQDRLSDEDVASINNYIYSLPKANK